MKLNDKDLFGKWFESKKVSPDCSTYVLGYFECEECIDGYTGHAMIRSYPNYHDAYHVIKYNKDDLLWSPGEPTYWMYLPMSPNMQKKKVE